MDLLRLTPSELHHWGRSLKGTVASEEKLKHLASRSEKRDSFSQRGRWAEAIFFLTTPLTEPQYHRASRWMLYFLANLANTVCPTLVIDSLRFCPNQLVGSPKQLTVAFPYKWLVLAYASQLPKSSEISNS